MPYQISGLNIMYLILQKMHIKKSSSFGAWVPYSLKALVPPFPGTKQGSPEVALQHGYNAPNNKIIQVHGAKISSKRCKI